MTTDGMRPRDTTRRQTRRRPLKTPVQLIAEILSSQEKTTHDYRFKHIPEVPQGKARKAYYKCVGRLPKELRGFLADRELLLNGSKEQPNAIRRMRTDEYREDVLECRAFLGIPPCGYGRREFNRVYKKLLGTGDEYFMNTIQGFADFHPLRKGVPMPRRVAFEQVVYKRPSRKFDITVGLMGSFKIRNGILSATLDDLVSPVPRVILRMIQRRIDNHDLSYAPIVEIEGSSDDPNNPTSGFWYLVNSTTD